MAHPVAQAAKVVLAGPAVGEAAADQGGSALLASLAVPRSPSLTIAIIQLELLSFISPILFRRSTDLRVREMLMSSKYDDARMAISRLNQRAKER